MARRIPDPPEKRQFSEALLAMDHTHGSRLFVPRAVLRTRSAARSLRFEFNTRSALLALAGHRNHAGMRPGCRLSGDLILAQDAGLGRQLQWLCACRP